MPMLARCWSIAARIRPNVGSWLLARMSRKRRLHRHSALRLQHSRASLWLFRVRNCEVGRPPRRRGQVFGATWRQHRTALTIQVTIPPLLAWAGAQLGARSAAEVAVAYYSCAPPGESCRRHQALHEAMTGAGGWTQSNEVWKKCQTVEGRWLRSMIPCARTRSSPWHTWGPAATRVVRATARRHALGHPRLGWPCCPQAPQSPVCCDCPLAPPAMVAGAPAHWASARTVLLPSLGRTGRNGPRTATTLQRGQKAFLRAVDRRSAALSGRAAVAVDSSRFLSLSGCSFRCMPLVCTAFS